MALLRFPIGACAASLLLAGCSETAPAPADEGIVVTNEAATAPAGPAPAEVRGQAFASAMLGGIDFVLASARHVAERGEPAAAKALGAKITDEFGTARDELVAIVQAEGLQATAVAGPSDVTDLAILSSTRGVPLAKAFAAQQQGALTLLIGTLRAYKNGGDNPRLQAWAAKHQGAINERLLDVQTLNGELEGAD